MGIPNVAALRELAMQRLRAEGSQPLSKEEFCLIGSMIGDAIAEEVQRKEAVQDHPLIRAVTFELEVLKLGKFEWVLSWLSPEHLGMQTHPRTVIGLAMILLEQEQLSEAEWEELRAAVRRHEAKAQ